MQTNIIQILDADKLLPILDASFSENKEFQLTASIALKLKLADIYAATMITVKTFFFWLWR